MFEQAFKNIDDVLWKEAGCASELGGLHRANFLALVPEISRRPGTGQGDGGRTEGKNTPSSSTRPTAGKAGQRPKTRTASSTTMPRSPATTCAISSTASCSPTCTGSSRKPTAPTRSNTRSAKSSARSKTRSTAATTCARSSTTSMNCASARRPKNMSFPTCTKPRSRTWATPGATAASTTPRAR